MIWLNELMQITLVICIPYKKKHSSFLILLKDFVLSKLHIVSNVLQLDYIGQALDLLVSVS